MNFVWVLELVKGSCTMPPLCMYDFLKALMANQFYPLLARLGVCLGVACAVPVWAQVDADVTQTERSTSVIETAQPTVSTQVSKEDFLNALAQAVPSSNASFYVQAVDEKTPLLAINAQRAQNPASVVKLVTSFAALQKFGASYQWHTRLLSQSTPDSNGALNSPLLLKGAGDPQLVIERLDDLVGQLKNRGVRQLNAPLWVDRSAFSPSDQHPGDFDGEPSLPYNALPDAALLNFHALSFQFEPATAKVRMVPWLDGFNLNNRVRFVEGDCPANGWKSTVNLSVMGYSAVVGGVYYSGCGEQQWHVHAYQLTANDYARGVLGALFKGHANLDVASCAVNRIWDKVLQRWHDCFAPTIVWTQNQAQDAADVDTTANWQTLASVASPPLSAMLKDMNFYSNNVMARQIYLDLSLQEHRPASLEQSAQEVHRILQSVGLSDRYLVMGNGSGLSRATRVSAQELGNMLVVASQNPAFYASLPRIGLEGTVQKRLTNTDMVGRGRMKTGTLNDVRAIAGYIDGRSGKRYAVVSIFDHPNAQTAASKRVHDLFMQWVGEQ